MRDVSNAEITREYLKAVAAMESVERVAGFYSSDIVFREQPSRIAPNGRVSGMEDIRRSFAQGRQLLESQQYQVETMVEHGDEVAVEIIWTGRLAVGFKELPAGSELKAFVAMFITFRDGKIVSQRNYDCYLPL